MGRVRETDAGKGLVPGNGKGHRAGTHTHVHPIHSYTHLGTCVCVFMHINLYIYLYIYTYTYIYTSVLTEPPQTLLGRGPFKDSPSKPRPAPYQPIGAHHPQPIKPRLPSGPPANQRLPPPPAVPALPGLAAAASAPRRDRALPPSLALPGTRPLGPAPRGLGAVTVPEPPVAVSAILEPYGAVRMRGGRERGASWEL